MNLKTELKLWKILSTIIICDKIVLKRESINTVRDERLMGDRKKSQASLLNPIGAV